MKHFAKIAAACAFALIAGTVRRLGGCLQRPFP